jgi:hypothetical protein
MRRDDIVRVVIDERDRAHADGERAERGEFGRIDDRPARRLHRLRHGEHGHDRSHAQRGDRNVDLFNAHGVHSESASSIEAPLSATMTVGPLVLPEVTVGNIDASMTRKPAMPCTRNRASTTAMVRRRSHHAGADRMEHGAGPFAKILQQLRLAGLRRARLHLMVYQCGERLGCRKGPHEPCALVHVLQVLFGRKVIRKDRRLLLRIG